MIKAILEDGRTIPIKHVVGRGMGNNEEFCVISFYSGFVLLYGADHEIFDNLADSHLKNEVLIDPDKAEEFPECIVYTESGDCDSEAIMRYQHIPQNDIKRIDFFAKGEN